MRLSRRFRFATALFALLSVLCMQLALAAYACPSLLPEQGTASVATAPTAHDGMAGCEGVVDIEQPTLCYAHSQVGNQSLDKPATPDVSPSAAVVLVPALPDLSHIHFPPPRHAAAASLMRAFPPIAIRNCCFRI